MSRPPTRRHRIARVLAGPVLGAAFALAPPLALVFGQEPGQDSGRTPAESPPADDRDAVGRKLREIEDTLGVRREQQRALDEQTRELDRELAELQRESVTAATAIQDHEETLSRLEADLRGLADREKTLVATLERRSEQFAKVLLALQRLARFPPEALIAMPMEPGEMVRSAILLRTAVPQIESRAARLKADLEALADLRDKTALRREAVAASAAGLEQQKTRLDRLLRRKAVLLARARAQSERAEREVRILARQADSLRELLDRLVEHRRRQEAEAAAEAAAAAAARAAAVAAAPKVRIPPRRPAPPTAAETGAGRNETAAEEPEIRTATLALPPARPSARPSDITPPKPKPPRPLTPISRARGDLRRPAAGTVSGHYGEALETGLSRKGVAFRTRPGARVVAPWDGDVVFAGVFRGYGQLLIIDHGEGYHSLLAGLARIDGTIGQHLEAGEPVGIMGHPETGRPDLYFELRRKGQPIDPLPWLAARKGKASG